MRCKICGWPYGPCQEKKRKSPFFYVYLEKRFLESVVYTYLYSFSMFLLLYRLCFLTRYLFTAQTIPCFMRINKTHLYGPGYEKILTDYDMKKGNRFRVEWDHPIDAFFAIFREGAGDIPKQGVHFSVRPFYPLIVVWGSVVFALICCYFSAISF